MPSPALTSLTSNLAQLRRDFLPPARKATIADYTQEELYRARGYIVLAHAELEHFLETICIEHCRSAVNSFESSGTLNPTIPALLWYSEGTRSRPPESVGEFDSAEKAIFAHQLVVPQGTSKTLVGAIKKAFQTYLVDVRDRNHGLKEKNLLPMLLPLGIDLRLVDPTFISDLDTFGSNRGQHAHKSLTTIRTVSDPFDDHDVVTRIVHGKGTTRRFLLESLADFENHFQGLHSTTPSRLFHLRKALQFW